MRSFWKSRHDCRSERKRLEAPKKKRYWRRIPSVWLVHVAEFEVVPYHCCAWKLRTPPGALVDHKMFPTQDGR